MQNPPTTNDFPSWIKLPEKYSELLKHPQEEFLPWYLFDRKRLLYRHEGLKERYPARTLFPFARHDYSDDVACWEKDKNEKVMIIHDFASPGYESRFVFPSFDAWYEYVLSMVE